MLDWAEFLSCLREFLIILLRGSLCLQLLQKEEDPDATDSVHVSVNSSISCCAGLQETEGESKDGGKEETKGAEEIE